MNAELKRLIRLRKRLFGMIKDSGNRREFESGAVRDIQEGKGRCDLMPLDIVGHILNSDEIGYIYSFQNSGSTILNHPK